MCLVQLCRFCVWVQIKKNLIAFRQTTCMHKHIHTYARIHLFEASRLQFVQFFSWIHNIRLVFISSFFLSCREFQRLKCTNHWTQIWFSFFLFDQFVSLRLLQFLLSSVCRSIYKITKVLSRNRFIKFFWFCHRNALGSIVMLSI